MTDAQLETERVALLAQEHDLLEAMKRLRLTPNDRRAHAAHHARLAAHDDRIRAYRYALTHRTPE
jgi:hypothetical protein